MKAIPFLSRLLNAWKGRENFLPNSIPPVSAKSILVNWSLVQG